MGYKVLVIDDMKSDFQQIKEAFQSLNHEAIWVTNGPMAEEELRKSPFNLIVLDQIFDHSDTDILVDNSGQEIEFEKGNDDLKAKQGIYILERLRNRVQNLPPILIASSHPLSEYLLSTKGIEVKLHKESIQNTKTLSTILEEIFQPSLAKINSIFSRLDLELDKQALFLLCKNQNKWKSRYEEILERFVKYISKISLRIVKVEHVQEFEKNTAMYKDLCELEKFEANFYKKYIPDIGSPVLEKQGLFDIYQNPAYKDSYFFILRPEYYYQDSIAEEQQSIQKFIQRMKQITGWLFSNETNLNHIPEEGLPNNLSWNKRTKKLSFRGIISEKRLKSWLQFSQNSDFQESVKKLYEKQKNRRFQEQGVYLPWHLEYPEHTSLKEDAPFTLVQNLLWFKANINISGFQPWKKFCMEYTGQNKMAIFQMLMERTQILSQLPFMFLISPENLWIKYDSQNQTISFAMLPVAFEEILNPKIIENSPSINGTNAREQMQCLVYHFLRGRFPHENFLSNQQVSFYLKNIFEGKSVKDSFFSFFQILGEKKGFLYQEGMYNRPARLQIKNETIEFYEQFFITGNIESKQEIPESIELSDCKLVFFMDASNRPIVFNNLCFERTISIIGCSIEENDDDRQKEIRFKNCIFKGQLIINKCNNIGIILENCIFESNTKLVITNTNLSTIKILSCRFQGNQNIESKRGVVEIKNNTIERNLDLAGNIFNGPVMIENSEIMGIANITTSEFIRGLHWSSFSRDSFKISECNFSSDNEQETLNFSPKMIEGNLVFSNISQKFSLKIRKLQITGNIQIHQNNNPLSIEIFDTNLQGNLTLNGKFCDCNLGPSLKIQGLQAENTDIQNLWISGTDFQGNVSFANAQIDKTDVSLPGRKIESEVQKQYQPVLFCGQVSFFKVKFKNLVDFSYTVFEKETNFKESIFYGNTLFQEARFYSYVSFENASFLNNLSFYHSNFEGVANFREVQFKPKEITDINFDRTRFIGLLNLDKIEIKEASLRFNEAIIEHIQMNNPEIFINSLQLQQKKLEKIKNPEEKKKQYSALFWQASMFEQIMLRVNAQEKADEFFCYARNYEYKAKGQSVKSFCLNLLWGYGTSFKKALLWMILWPIWVAAAIYLFIPELHDLNKIMDYFMNFFTGAAPNLEILTWWIKGLTSIVLLIQIFLMNLFFAALIRKFLRN